MLSSPINHSDMFAGRSKEQLPRQHASCRYTIHKHLLTCCRFSFYLYSEPEPIRPPSQSLLAWHDFDITQHNSLHLSLHFAGWDAYTSNHVRTLNLHMKQICVEGLHRITVQCRKSSEGWYRQDVLIHIFIHVDTTSSSWTVLETISVPFIRYG